jgi:hypothetical protein
VLALFDAFTGMIIEMMAFPLYTHEQSKVWILDLRLGAGDLLVASAVSSAERETGGFARSRTWRCWLSGVFTGYSAATRRRLSTSARIARPAEKAGPRAGS